MCYYILDRDIYFKCLIELALKFADFHNRLMRTEKKSMERQFTLPYPTSVFLPPSKKNHTVSYVKRVLGGGALYSAV